MSVPTVRSGELFIVGFKGAVIPPWVRRFESRYGLGGIILFDYDATADRYGNNVVSPGQVAALCTEIRALRSKPLIFVDQEGGRVCRLKASLGFAPLPSQAEFSQLPNEEKRTLAAASYRELKSLGFHFNLAPVVDLNLNPDNPDIGALGRAYSAHPAEVAANVRLLDTVARQVNLGLCLKHFPGLGGAAVSSHDEVTRLDGSIAEDQLDLFHTLGAEICGGAILVSHGIVDRWERATPVSLSTVALGSLRQRLPDVLLISDDLQMEGLRKLFDLRSASIKGLRAGLDLLLIGNNLRDEQAQLESLAGWLEAAISRDRGLKMQYGAARDRVARRKRQFYDSNPT